MKQENTLLVLTEGQEAYVSELRASGSIRRRLQDLGIIEGTKISCVQKSPFGGLAAYWIRGAVIALRNEDAKTIMIG